MKFTDRFSLAMDILTGNRVPEVVKLKGEVISSSVNITGGSGEMKILGTFSQRGYGGLQTGDIVNISFLAIQEETPQDWTFGDLPEK